MAKYENAVPNPQNLITSLRDIGYNLKTAIADIIDNSIASKATKVDIYIKYCDENSWVAIIDNGHGMNNQDLKNAMILGSSNPRCLRDSFDLGRFGLGMKTASFSQAKKLTVISKKKSLLCGRVWDLQYFEDNDNTGWNVQILNEKEIQEINQSRNISESGTLILWEKLDRLIDRTGKGNAEDIFWEKIDEMRIHLGLVFHRYLAGEKGLKKLLISINGTPVEPFDPFNSQKSGTPFPPEKIGNVRIHAYLLPHHSTVTPDEYKKLGGKDGYTKSQGFYVYRNSRLLVYGTWFKLAPMSETTKLVRIKIDLPNSADFNWSIDIKKSRAIPPENIRLELKRIIEKVRETSTRVYTKKGTVISRKEIIPFWEEYHIGKRIEYIINTNHPVIRSFLTNLSSRDKISAIQLFKTIASFIPYDSIFANMATKPEELKPEDQDYATLIKYSDDYFNFMKSIGNTFEQTAEIFLKVEPFCKYQDFCFEYLKNNKYKVNI